MQKEIRINNHDYTALVTRYGYSVSYTKIDGGQGGTMLDGSTTVDVLAIKTVITVPLMPLFESQLNGIVADALSSDYPTLYYFDPRTSTYRTIETIMSEPQMQHVGQSITNDEIWLAGTLTFTER